MHKLITILIMFPALVCAQKKEFDRNELIKGVPPADFFKPLPNARWLSETQLALVEMKAGKPQITVIDAATGKAVDLEQAERPVAATRSVMVKDNDLFLKTPAGLTQLTKDSLEEKNPFFSPDSQYIAYTKANNLYTWNLRTGKETQLTTDGTTTLLNGYATWVYWEEIFGRRTQFRAFWWSPDSKKIAYMRFDESKTPMFPLYSSEGQHGFLEETRYPKSGDPNPTARIGFVSPEGGATTWADFDENEEQYFGWPEWLSDGSGLMVQWINRGNDHLKLYNVSPVNGAKKQLYEETQKTWINIDEAENRLTLLEETGEMLLISDKTGWNHLYLYSLDGQLKNAVTSGSYTVTGVIGIDTRKRVVYFQARGRENSARFDLYRVDLNGKNLKRLTFGNYTHGLIIASPDYRYFATTYSNLNTPPQMAVIDQNGKIVYQAGSGEGDAFHTYERAKTELLRVKSDDGLFELPMVITYPTKMETGKRYPVLVSIYGGPDAGRVFDQWNWTPTRQLYAEEGLIQVALDHRASGHFGKEGLNYLHRNLGYWEITDYSTMVRHLIKQGIADPERIGITGFSYGGYMSCYALTYASDLFTHGMAGGSVTDWKYYDSAYTERFMDTPQENPEGYKSSSVLTYVPQYKGMLQIVHGTMDDNVHLQNSIQLIHDLQAANKEFEMMIYPNGRHGWGGSQGIHFNNLKTKFIYKYLIRQPVPEGLLK